MKRYHIQAWGHPVHPDLDYESDVDDRDVYMQYPCVSVALLNPILHSVLMAALEEPCPIQS